VNFTGFENQEYDISCAESLTSGLNAELLRSANQRIQEILAEQLPVLPLFYHVKAMVSRPDLCGLTLDVSSRSPLRDIEVLQNSSQCGNE